MKECSLDLFFLITDRPFFFFFGAGAHLFQQLKLHFLDKAKAIIFVTIKSLFYNCF